MDEAEKKLLFMDNITIKGDYSVLNPDISKIDSILAEYSSAFRFSNSEMHYSIKFLFDVLKEYSVYKDIPAKNIIAAGGRIGSGKSSLFNSLYNSVILPSDSSPDNSVPVFICSGNSRDSYMINSSGNFFIADDDCISYVFKGSNSRTYGHLINSVMLYSSSFPLKKSVFLDLPGYSPSSDSKQSEKTAIAYNLERLKYCNALLWTADIDIKKFTISSEDIEILKHIPDSIPKIIIISKADLFSEKELPELTEKIKKILRVNKIQYIDVLAYSDKKPEKYDKYRILAYLDRWDKTSSMFSFQSMLKKIIKSSDPHDKTVSDFYESVFPIIQRISNKIYNIENVFQSENKNGFIPVEDLQNEKNVKISNPLKNLDLSKVKVSELPVPNPEKIFRNYNDSNSTDLNIYERYINTVSLILSDKMQNINPVFSYSDCDSKFKSDISAVIARSFGVDILSDSDEGSASSRNENRKKNETSSDKKKSSDRTSRSSRRKNSEAEADPQNENEEMQQNNSSASRRERRSSGSSHRRLR